MILSKQVLST